jgi:hydrogenase-4 component B
LFAAGRLNHLQFLTIRRYLGLVFLALVGLLAAIAVWT